MGVTRCRETVLWAASCWRVSSLAAQEWRWLCSAAGDMCMYMLMLTSTVWYRQLAVSPLGWLVG
eukprot:784711-Prymnesium_polylepis.1